MWDFVKFYEVYEVPHRKMTIKEYHNNLVSKKFSAAEFVSGIFRDIEKENDYLNVFLSLYKEEALLKAKKVDEKLNRGEAIGILEGAPYAVKDNILIKNTKTTAGSKMLENYIAPYDATVIEKLNAEGAIALGKTNLDEFAMGSSTENSAFGPTKNPYDATRVAGGSSGGSAAAVAKNWAVFSLGSDTGGSVRQPASFCGVFGLKPTYGCLSRWGLIAMASSLDQIGIFANSTDDIAIVLKVLSGKDELDATSQDKTFNWEGRDFDIKNFLKNIKIGLPAEYFQEGLNSEIKKIVKEKIGKLEQLGVKVLDISLPLTPYALAVYYIIMPAEVSSNLARYDGIKYGYTFSKEQTKDLIDYYMKTRSEGFGAEAKRRILLGTFVLSHGYADKFYLKANEIRNLMIQEFQEAFKQVDIIITPTSPTLPFKIGEKIKDPLSMYLADIYTVSANLAYIPALSVPAGKIGALPVGLQLMGAWWEEEKMLKLSKVIESLR